MRSEAMHALRRGARASLQSARTSLRQQRRLESSSSHEGSHSHQQTSSGTFDPNERLGAGFYIGIACIPAVFVVHDLATSKDPYLSRLIGSYADFKDEWFKRNDLHHRAVTQAAADRNLFLNSKGSDLVDLKHSETFNQGSPYNVWAGAYINLDKVISHYQKQNEEDQAAKVKAVEEGRAGSTQFDPRMKGMAHNPTLP